MTGKPPEPQLENLGTSSFNTRYPAYKGNEPYVFISYAHADSDSVYREITRLNEMGVNVWYDEGIAPGNEWTEDIANALSKCSLFIVMMTNRAAQSNNVKNEINYAISEHKPFIAIHLEETELSKGMKLQMGSMQAILKYNMSDDEYARKITSALTQRGIKASVACAPMLDETGGETTNQIPHGTYQRTVQNLTMRSGTTLKETVMPTQATESPITSIDADNPTALKKFRSNPILARIATVSLWIIEGFFGIVVIESVIHPENVNNVLGFRLSFTLLEILIVMYMREKYLAMVRIGRYAQSTNRIVEYFKKLFYTQSFGTSFQD